MENLFIDFLKVVEPQHQNFVKEIHESLIASGYKIKVENKATGYFVSYSHPKTKQSVFNFFFRKKGMKVRVYPKKINIEILSKLSSTMRKELDSAMICRRLVNPADCNQKCVMGYDFTLDGKRYQKCRYNCFEFFVTAESMPVVMELVKGELWNNTNC